ncbi:MAG: LCP family protein [Lachnospiraceae bacterium]|nr:LCP family protein [Lachnospiraceae bacterium]
MSANAATLKRGNRGLKIAIFLIELVIIVAMLCIVWKVFQTTETAEGPIIADVQEDDIIINEPVKESSNIQEPVVEPVVPESKGYWNIALFGVDATNTEGLVKGSRSDTIMVASINMDTGDIKLISVYRDTYMNRSNDTYGKCNAAYRGNGGAQAMSMLNMNMDLDITNFVTVGYHAIKECVDGLGGIWIEVDKGELQHINNYQISIIRDTDIPQSEYIEVKDSGYQLLNGLQAAAYCRIRYTDNDFKRAERQREVLKAMEEQAKKLSVSELTDLLPVVLKYVCTNIDEVDIWELIKNINNYSIVDEGGFPTEDLRIVKTLGQSKGSCVVPMSLEENVVWLHEFLFDKEDYQVSETVQEIDAQIKADVAPYLD